MAAVKAVAEVVERMCYLDSLEDKDIFSEQTFTVSSGFSSAIIKSSCLETLPSRNIRSSNGWAVHFSPKKAFENAVREAIERHTLLVSYIKMGWNGFEPIHHLNINGYDCSFLQSPLTIAGFKSGVCYIKSKCWEGGTFGYTCSHRDLKNVENWNHAIFEAYEQVVAADENEQFFSEKVDDVIKEYQRFFLKNDIVKVSQNQPSCQNLSKNSISGSFVIFDLAKKWELTFPLYACFVFGGELFPLLFRSELKSNQIYFFEKILEGLGVDNRLPERHPIL